MTKNTSAKSARFIGLPASFDMAKFKADVAADDASRQPSQDELAAMYAGNRDIQETFVLHEQALDAIIARICEQDPRMVASGRKVLKRMLRESAGRSVGRRSAKSPRVKAAANVVAPMTATSPVESGAEDVVDFDDFPTADIYGG